MKGKSNRFLILAVLIVPLLCINWHFLEARQEQDNLNRDLVNEKMPPTLALTTQAVGPFRGLISNGLWWRAVRLQDEGQHFEAIQLADWISSLQPKISSVWTWQAWNMAYNISVNYDDPEEQWKWVLEGISLLRDKGLRYNPRDADISMDLGRLFMEKVGKDPNRRLYWAWTVKRYLPSGSQADILALNRAPATKDALLKLPDVSDYLNRAETNGLTLGRIITVLLDEEDTADLPEVQRDLLTNPSHDNVREVIRSYGARRGVEDQLNMDLDHMTYIDITYGPFDWRLYQAHVVYWTASESYDDFDRGRTDDGEIKKYSYPYHRQAMVDAFYSGRILYIDDRGMTTGPNLKLAANIHRFTVNHLNDFPDNPGARELAVHFHEMAVLMLYTQMYEKEARAMFDDYRGHIMSTADKKRWTFETFVAERAPILFRSSDATKGKAMIFSVLTQAYYWAGQGDPYRARGYENLAKLIYTKIVRSPQLLAKKQEEIPPFQDMKQTLLDGVTGPRSPFPKAVIARLKALKGDQVDIILKEPAKDTRETLDLGLDAHD